MPMHYLKTIAVVVLMAMAVYGCDNDNGDSTTTPNDGRWDQMNWDEQDWQ
jgi:hypothetical protein